MQESFEISIKANTTENRNEVESTVKVAIECSGKMAFSVIRNFLVSHPKVREIFEVAMSTLDIDEDKLDSLRIDE